MSTKPHVGIVGAGLSGLRCADILVQDGVRVTILEARDRIGGRVGFSPRCPRYLCFFFRWLSVMSHGESEIIDHGALLIGFCFFLGLGASGGSWRSFGGSVCLSFPCYFSSFPI